MSMTKETQEFKETFGTFAPDPPLKSDTDAEQAERRKAAREAEPDIIDDIISYFEENMQVDGLPAHRGEETPDIETYIGDKIAARDFVIGKMRKMRRDLMTREQELKELHEDMDVLFEEIRKVEKRIIALEED
jgi:hypothetical protein